MTHRISCCVDLTLPLRLADAEMQDLLAVLVLSGSSLAATRWQRSLVMWLAEQADVLEAGGQVAFDLDELVWDPGELTAQKHFWLTLIGRAATGYRWRELVVAPGAIELCFPLLRHMIERYQPAPQSSERRWRWREAPEVSACCPVHPVLMHAGGCFLCNSSLCERAATLVYRHESGEAVLPLRWRPTVVGRRPDDWRPPSGPADPLLVVRGREGARDLILLPNERRLARRHFELCWRPDAQGAMQLCVSDLGSPCGTSVNGRPVGDWRPLADGDRLFFGSFQLALAER